jgi:hypothetical protein
MQTPKGLTACSPADPLQIFVDSLPGINPPLKKLFLGTPLGGLLVPLSEPLPQPFSLQRSSWEAVNWLETSLWSRLCLRQADSFFSIPGPCPSCQATLSVSSRWPCLLSCPLIDHKLGHRFPILRPPRQAAPQSVPTIDVSWKSRTVSQLSS